MSTINHRQITLNIPFASRGNDTKLQGFENFQMIIRMCSVDDCNKNHMVKTRHILEYLLAILKVYAILY